MFRIKPYILLITLLLALVGCQPDILSNDPTAQLAFSQDSVLFDTVFTTMGSSTKQMMVYNPNKNAIINDEIICEECMEQYRKYTDDLMR